MLKERKYSNLTEAIEGLKKEGFTVSFVFEDGALRVPETEEIFQPQQLSIVASYRFEGESNPDDMAVLYAIETKSGLKGTISDAFGLYANEELGEFIEDIEDKREEHGTQPNVLPSDPVK